MESSRPVVKCPYCGIIVLVEKGKLIPHKDTYPLRWCEGGNRQVVDGKVYMGERK